MSLPVRECGLKYIRFDDGSLPGVVTPCAGVWIEILKVEHNIKVKICHSLCGSVD